MLLKEKDVRDRLSVLFLFNVNVMKFCLEVAHKIILYYEFCFKDRLFISKKQSRS